MFRFDFTVQSEKKILFFQTFSFNHLCLSLLGLYSVHLYSNSNYKPVNKLPCLFTAAIRHYYVLSTAMWIACQALHLSHQPLFTNRIRNNFAILSEKQISFVRNATIFCHVWPLLVVLANTQLIRGYYGSRYVRNFTGGLCFFSTKRRKFIVLFSGYFQEFQNSLIIFSTTSPPYPYPH